MHLLPSLSSLLPLLLLAITLSHARPLEPERGLTLPLKRLHTTKRNLHPQLVRPFSLPSSEVVLTAAQQLQQQINRSSARLARITRRTPPSEHELAARIAERAVHLGYLRPGKHKYDPKTRKVHSDEDAEETPKGVVQGVAAELEGAAAAEVKGSGKSKGNGKGKASGQAGGAGGAAGGAGGAAGGAGGSATGAGGASTGAGGAATGAGGAANGAGGTANGTGAGAVPVIPEVDVQAGINGGLTLANAPDDTDSVGLDIDANDTGYVATVSLGTPPADYLILMDSGSSDFWVGAEGCQTLASEGGGACAANHKTLGTDSSSTFQNTGTAFAVTYGSGSVSGTIITDNVVLAGLSLPAHTFGVADIESTDFSASSITFDGLMGLAQQGLSQQQTPTPVESLASAGLIQAPITSFKLSRLADDLNDGEVTFGSLDPAKFQADTLVTLKNVNTEGFWEGDLDAVTVDGTSTGLTGRTAILDTGTTLIIAPPADAAAVHALIPGAQSDGQGGFTFSCTTNVSVALTFGGTSFAIDPRDILFAPVDPNDLTGDCISGISAGEVGGADEWLVGDVFLKNAYFSVNEQTNAIQLAKLT
ncbi:acid protease [Calocera viscosa TUFC12733]|uniref:Acid protease n=1 Tax=Calocera viscosa (strain TUFC12733) TaxID=1330018 RepID=A0A167MFX7_CALVF|nr:acid protease [Calocera viscosa TUFC12733]